jgi:hypothetical protein
VENAVLMYFGFAMAAGLFVLLDWLGRRKDRRTRDHHA